MVGDIEALGDQRNVGGIIKSVRRQTQSITIGTSYTNNYEYFTPVSKVPI